MTDKLVVGARLQKLCLDHINPIVITLAQVVRTDDLPVVSRCIVLASSERKYSELTKNCMLHRIQSSESMEELLAQNTLYRHIIQDIMLYSGKSWVKECLAPGLKKVLALKKNLSPDPRTNIMTDEAKIKFVEIIKETLTGLVGGINAMSVELRTFFCWAAAQLDAKWPSGEDDSSTNLMKLLTGHLLLPALLQPNAWGVSKEAHSADSSRAALLLSKIFKRIASGVHFESSSPLASFNVTSKKYQSKLKQFSSDLIASVQLPTTEDLPNCTEIPTPEVHDAAFQCFHYCIYIWKDAINDVRNAMSNTPPAEARVFFDLMGILEEHELIEGKPEIISDFTIIGLDKSTKPPTKSTTKKSVVSPNKAEDSKAGKPYVRQLSEKWNKEHQLMLIEQKKRAEVQEELQSRKKQRENKRQEDKMRQASPSNVFSGSSSISKTSSQSSTQVTTPTSSNAPDTTPEQSGKRRSEGKRSSNDESSVAKAIDTDSEDSLVKPIILQTSDILDSSMSQNDTLPVHSLPSPIAEESHSETEDTTTTESSSRMSLATNTTATSNEETDAEPANLGSTTSTPSKPRRKRTSRGESAFIDLAARSTSPTSTKKSRTKRSTSSIDQIHSTPPTSESPPPHPTTTNSSLAVEESMIVKPSTSPSGVTILSIHDDPSPSFVASENVPVSPRTADVLLRERSNSVSLTSPTSNSKKEKAMGLLGISPEQSRSSQSMAQVVRELGVSNAKLQKELEVAQEQNSQLELEIVRLRQLHEANSSKMSEFHSKLTQSILYRRLNDTRMRRLTLHCKRTLNPSLDDNTWDYQGASLSDRRAVLAATIFSRAGKSSISPATLPSISRTTSESASTAGKPKKSKSKKSSPSVSHDSKELKAHEPAAVET